MWMALFALSCALLGALLTRALPLRSRCEALLKYENHSLLRCSLRKGHKGPHHFDGPFYYETWSRATFSDDDGMNRLRGAR